MKSFYCTVVAAALSTLVTSNAHAQLVINEVFENPPNGGDETWEYIELMGPSGYDLSGYAVFLIKGGRDIEEPFDAPDGSQSQRTPEIDEAFSLDGWSVGPDGLFVIYNASQFGFTGLSPYLMENPDYKFFMPESPENKRFLNGASMASLHIPSVDTQGNLSNDDSSTYLLVRKRPGHELNGSGQSVYADDYGWKKTVNPDVEFNSRLDFGDEDTLGVPVYLGSGLNGAQTAPFAMEPVQIIDEIAWSNNGGKEYVVSGRGVDANEISETPRFNPDAVSRLRYLTSNPLVGTRIDNSENIDPTNLADENWVYGETLNVEPGTPEYLLFKPLLEVGPDLMPGTLDDELNHLAPTDPDGPFYSFSGPGDDDPLEAPFLQHSPAFDPSGTLLFDPYDISGFEISPGGFNHAPVGTPLAGTPLAQQFSFIEGDINFDGAVDFEDVSIAKSLLGAGLDDQSMAINDRNTDDTSDDSEYMAWEHQLDRFNTLLALIRMDLSDGTTGEWNSGLTVTQADVDRVVALAPQCSAADLAEPYGMLNFFDVSAFLSAYTSMSSSADINGDGELTFFDVSLFLTTFNQGCP